MSGQAKVLTFKEKQKVFNNLETLRDQVIFYFGMYLGLRIGEIISLKTSQVYKDGQVRESLTVKRLKKRKPTYTDIPIHPKLKVLLKRYFSEVDPKIRKRLPRGGWLFPSWESTSGHISRSRAHVILRQVFDGVGLPEAKTHSMRRSFLTHMSRSGVPIRTIQQISGHSNLAQLQAYIQIDPEDVSKAIRGIKY